MFYLVTSVLLWKKEEQACWPSTRGPHQSRGGSEEEREKEEEEEAALCAQEEALLCLSGQHTCWISTGAQSLNLKKNDLATNVFHFNLVFNKLKKCKSCKVVLLSLLAGRAAGRKKIWMKMTP